MKEGGSGSSGPTPATSLPLLIALPLSLALPPSLALLPILNCNTSAISDPILVPEAYNPVSDSFGPNCTSKTLRNLHKEMLLTIVIVDIIDIVNIVDVFSGVVLEETRSGRNGP